MSEQFWKDNPQVLLDENFITNFFPKKTQTISEQLNALMRLSIYSGVLIALYKRDLSYLSIPLVFGVVSIFIYNNPKLIEKFMASVVKENFEQDLLAEFVPPKKETQTQKCIGPTLDNPFMNPTIEESVVREIPACDITDPKIKEEASNKFQNNLFRDTSDLCGKMSSQRQFYSIPNNDTISFANWLYRNEDICKVNNDYCLRYEDPRANRR
jgi:hypothetical protein